MLWADGHCQRAISFAKRITVSGELRTETICEVLSTLGCLRMGETKPKEARIIYEECYNLLAIQYNPVHPKIVDAVSNLIKNLCIENEYALAETYARLTYETLMSPYNDYELESAAVATGIHNLSYCIFYSVQADGPGSEGYKIEEAETLAREALRITEKIWGSSNHHVADRLINLTNILFLTGVGGDPIKELYERSLSIKTFLICKDSPDLLGVLDCIGVFHHKTALIYSTFFNEISKQEHLTKVEYYYEESYLICLNVMDQQIIRQLHAVRKLTM
jgi:hypothetical protein